MEHGVAEERIIFINLISSPEGLRTFCTKYPLLRVITGWIDKGLDERAYMCVVTPPVYRAILIFLLSQASQASVTLGNDGNGP